jgi:protocatechuate 3,4-dioxygenase beta subunit
MHHVPSKLTRRKALWGSSALALASCGDRVIDPLNNAIADASASPLGDAGNVSDSGRMIDAGQPVGDAGQPMGDAGQPGADAGQATADAGVIQGWATGGTKAITGMYRDPFEQGLGSMCVLSAAQVEGPCRAPTVSRKDISEGVDGLPVRLAFKVVNAKCQPIAGAVVEVWHTSFLGLYSTEYGTPFCNKDDAVAKRAGWFRGTRTADALGRVDFDTCFPGWYPGRTTHIHFSVKVKGVESIISQLYFDDALSSEVFSTHPTYKARGNKDTSNQGDGILQDAKGDLFLQTERQADGVMLAWKALSVRA